MIVAAAGVMSVGSRPPATINQNHSIHSTNPGFRYDPNEFISVSGQIGSHTHVDTTCIYGDHDDEIAPEFDYLYPLQQNGPNVAGSSRSASTHSEYICEAYDCEGSVDESFLSSFVTSANMKVISFTAGSISSNIGYAETGNDPAGDAHSVASGGHEPYGALTLSFPFYVSHGGWLFIEQSYLFLYVNGGGENHWYEAYAEGYWSVRKSGGSTVANASYWHLKQVDFEAHNEQGDQPGSMIFLTAGDYVFTATYFSSIVAGCDTSGYQNSASFTISPTDHFRVKLNYLIE